MSADWREHTPQAEAEGLVIDQIGLYLDEGVSVESLMEEEGYDRDYAERVAHFMAHAEVTITFPSKEEIERIIADDGR